jgi:hypothetical protein
MREKINNYTLTRPKTKKTIGWFLVVVGFIALVAPIIPGAPLIFFGLEILGLRLLLTDKVKRFFIKYFARREEAPVTAPVSDMEEAANQAG